MSEYSNKSLDRLKKCHQDLQTTFNYVVKYWDNTIITGPRGEAEQNKKFKKGLSKVKYPNSKHNSEPSMAVDAAPYPSLYSSKENMIAFGGFVLGVHTMLKSYGLVEHDMRWGSDWDMDDNLDNNNFNDPGHFELI
jgi:peptidoglycan L-alanyl-D-glutamate endopeptidase CwlK